MCDTSKNNTVALIFSNESWKDKQGKVKVNSESMVAGEIWIHEKTNVIPLNNDMNLMWVFPPDKQLSTIWKHFTRILFKHVVADEPSLLDKLLSFNKEEKTSSMEKGSVSKNITTNVSSLLEKLPFFNKEEKTSSMEKGS